MNKNNPEIRRIFNQLHSLVGDAILWGVKPEEFKLELAESWKQCLEEDTKEIYKKLKD